MSSESFPPLSNFLISFLIRLGGEKLEQKIRKYINVIGWIVLGLIAVVIAYYCYKKTIGM